MTPYTRKINYYECDRMGITHHSNYIRFMEEARIHYLEQLGYGFEKLEEQGIVSPVLSLTVNYKHPTTFPDVIQIELGVEKLSSLKITFSYTMSSKGKTVCEATSTHCFMKDGQPVIMEQEFPQLYEAIRTLKENGNK